MMEVNCNNYPTNQWGHPQKTCGFCTGVNALRSDSDPHSFSSVNANLSSATYEGPPSQLTSSDVVLRRIKLFFWQYQHWSPHDDRYFPWIGQILLHSTTARDSFSLSWLVSLTRLSLARADTQTQCRLSLSKNTTTWSSWTDMTCVFVCIERGGWDPITRRTWGHMLIPGVYGAYMTQCFSWSYMIVNWISLGFGQLATQLKTSLDAN